MRVLLFIAQLLFQKRIGVLARNSTLWFGEVRTAGEEAGKGKGCGIGYVLAADSCERPGDVDACTTAALDVITAFAVPSPGCPSQSSRIFRVRLPFGSPRRANHPAYFGLATDWEANPFS